MAEKTHTMVKAHKRKLPKLGSGARFKAIEEKAKENGARDPGAVAAAAGIAKYGQHRMEHMAAAGRHRAMSLAQVQARRNGR